MPLEKCLLLERFECEGRQPNTELLDSMDPAEVGRPDELPGRTASDFAWPSNEILSLSRRSILGDLAWSETTRMSANAACCDPKLLSGSKGGV